MGFFIGDAWAQDGGAAAGGFLSLLPLILIFVIFYFLLLRPQVKRAKEHKKMVSELSRGDEVISNGGLLGRITRLDDQFVSLEVADGVVVRLQRTAVSAMVPKGTIKREKAADKESGETAP